MRSDVGSMMFASYDFMRPSVKEVRALKRGSGRGVVACVVPASAVPTAARGEQEGGSDDASLQAYAAERAYSTAVCV